MSDIEHRTLASQIIKRATPAEISVAKTAHNQNIMNEAQNAEDAMKEQERLAKLDAQALFRKELAPLIAFAEAVSKIDVLDTQYAGMREDGDQIHINTGIIYAAKLGDPVLETQHVTSLEKFISINSVDKTIKRKLAERIDKDLIEKTLTGMHNLNDILKNLNELGPISTSIYIKANEFGENSSNRCRPLVKESTSHGDFYHFIDAVHMYGDVFERGKTTAHDVNKFTADFVGKFIEHHAGNDEILAKFRKLVKQHFGVDLEGIQETSKILVAVTSDISARSDSEVMALSREELTPIDESILNKTVDEVHTEVKEAMMSDSSFALLKLGADILELSKTAACELTEVMLPQALAKDANLISQIKDHIDALNQESEGRGLGVGFLKKMLSFHKEQSNDPRDHVISNLTALATSLKQNRQAVLLRGEYIESQTGRLEKVCRVLETYKVAFNNAIDDAPTQSKAQDLRRLNEIFRIHSVVASTTAQGIDNAVRLEKSAYMALLQTDAVMGMLAVSVQNALTQTRKGQVTEMISNSGAALKDALEDAARVQGVQTQTLPTTTADAFALVHQNTDKLALQIDSARKAAEQTEAEILIATQTAQEALLKISP